MVFNLLVVWCCLNFTPSPLIQDHIALHMSNLYKKDFFDKYFLLLYYIIFPEICQYLLN